MRGPSDIPLRRIRLSGSAGTLADRIKRVPKRWRLVLRLSLACGLSFFVATQIFGHTQAFFAPVAAVIVTIAGAGVRVRAMLELIIGVSVGVLAGELIILTIGRGAWQLALVVALAMVLSTLAGLKGLALTQAVNSAVLLAAVVPVAGAGNPAVTRFIDALIGGAAGLAMIMLVPRNPVRDIDNEIQDLLKRLASVLARCAQAMRTSDPAVAYQALDDARAMQPGLEALESTAAKVTEVARMAPMRWKQRAHVGLYVGAVRDLDNAIRDARVLSRRTAAMLRHGEQAPARMDQAVDLLANAVQIYADNLSAQADFERAQHELVAAARIGVEALPGALTLNSAAIAAQVRSLAADLLYASGASRDDIDQWLAFDDDADHHH